MLKAIYYKEWIKTRLFAVLSLVVSLGMAGFAVMRIARVVKFKGVEHLWEILISRDVVFIENLRYLPPVLGAVLAIVQFVPEVLQKRLKLTMHLPCPQQKMMIRMLLYGVAMLGVLFVLQYAVVLIYLNTILAPELVSRILLTSLPWYVCSLNAYFLMAWICIEPAWRRKLVNMLITAGVIRICFLSAVPQAYDCFVPVLALFTACTLLFPLLSVRRFKEGCQD